MSTPNQPPQPPETAEAQPPQSLMGKKVYMPLKTKLGTIAMEVGEVIGVTPEGIFGVKFRNAALAGVEE